MGKIKVLQITKEQAMNLLKVECNYDLNAEYDAYLLYCKKNGIGRPMLKVQYKELMDGLRLQARTLLGL